jgi:murein DD-endopeptidase MepM/ murein hydrolase activator NlpD
MRRSAIRLLVALALVVGALVVPSPPVSRAVVTPGFSDPVWWPLREPALTSCAWTNCLLDNSTYHGYYAVDFVDYENGIGTPAHDPIHAAGSGIFHVGQIDPGCREPGDVGRQGTWAWIDHGGGVASYYGHLDSITAAEGAWVTPATQIGTMGNSGSGCGGGPYLYYLHFEIRYGGYWGDGVSGGVKQPIPSLKACRNGQVRTYPNDLPGPWTSWNQISIPDRETVPATDNTCIPDTFAVPPRPTGVTSTVRPTSLVLGWDAPSVPVSEIVVSVELWSPAALKYGYPKYVSIPVGSRSYEFANLIEGRQYRINVSFRNEVGSSRWPRPHVRVPGARPDPPTTRYVNEYIRSISYGWNRPAWHGYPISGYQVAIRRWLGSSWTSWSYVRTADGYRRFDNLVSGATYQFKVRALNAIGWSRWSAIASGVPS